VLFPFYSNGRYGNRAAVDLLLASGANVNAIDSVSSYLFLLLLRFIIVYKTASRTTPLLEAARAGYYDICQILIRHGANCCHQDIHVDAIYSFLGIF
jgi:ankyrin repeat protein